MRLQTEGETVDQRRDSARRSMPSTSTGLVPQNGSQPSADVLADFFAKLARFEYAVLSQQHPRYRLPPAEVERLAPAPSKASFSSPSHQTFDALPNGTTTQRAAAPTTQSSLSSLSSPPGLLPRKQPGEKTVLARPASPKIDPVLLTKSDDLVRAELNLKRIRIEKTLKESVNNAKRDSAKEKDHGFAVGPITFDTARVLESAMSLVKPQSGLTVFAANEHSPISSSADEASYYSSQANSWTKSPGHKGHDSHDSHAHIEQRSGGHIRPIQSSGSGQYPAGATVREPRVSGLGPRDNADVIRRADKLPPSNLRSADATDSSGNSQKLQRDVDELREESYSPPGIADEDPPQPLPDMPNHSLPKAVSSARQPPQIPYAPPRARESESYSPPPPPQIPVVPNHLTAPLAPQPSRISPIALAHMSQSAQNGGNAQQMPQQTQRNGRQDKKKTKSQKAKEGKKQQNTSDSGPRKVSGQQSLSTSRKRRRETDNDDEGRRSPGQRAAASPSPVPYIKQEPMSPPLTGRAAAEPPRRLVLRDDGRAEIEVMSPRHNTQLSGARKEVYGHVNTGLLRQGSQMAPRHVIQEPIVIDESDGPSPVVRRRAIRDDRELRRVASLQYAAAPYSPVEYTQRHTGEQQYIRPVSRTVAERPVSAQYRYYEEPEMQSPMQHRRQERRASPPIFVGDDYMTQIPRINVQPAPKRRIVVDQYGNEYIAVPARAMANHSAVREIPEYGEAASPYGQQALRQQSMHVEPGLTGNRRLMRQPPHVIELDDNEDDYRRMPPPPQVVPRKRHIDLRDERLMEAPYYATRSASLQPLPPAGGNSPQYMSAQLPSWNVDDGPPPSARERAYSARPNLAQHGNFYGAAAEWK